VSTKVMILRRIKIWFGWS